MAAPTIIYLSTGKVGTNGTDKSVPYDHEFWCRPYSDMGTGKPVPYERPVAAAES